MGAHKRKKTETDVAFNANFRALFQAVMILLFHQESENRWNEFVKIIFEALCISLDISKYSDVFIKRCACFFFTQLENPYKMQLWKGISAQNQKLVRSKL